MARDERHVDVIKEQFAQQAEGYARLTTDLRPRETFDRVSFIGPIQSDDVLDVACGTGSLTLALAPHVRSVTGIDVTPAMIDKAKAAQAEAGIENVRWRVGEAEPLPFENGSFSLVTCSVAFHHLTDPVAVLSQMKRVCKRGGRVAVLDVTPAPRKSGAFDRIERLRDPSHTHALTLSELREAGRRVGLVESRHQSHAAGPVSLEAILATSFPTEASLDDIRRLYKEDADSGEDRFGLCVEEKGRQLLVTFPMSVVVWENCDIVRTGDTI